MGTNQKVNPMNAEETKAKMDKWVEARKLIARLDREIFGVRRTIMYLRNAMDDENSYSCSIELEDESCSTQTFKDADGFHGKSYEAFQESMRLDSVKEAEERSYENDE